MLRFLAPVAALLLVVFVVCFGASALAAAPEPWALGLQPAASPVKNFIDAFHNELLVIITLITLFVLALLVWVVVRYNNKANPTPASFTHNTQLEVIWTLIPVAILIVIAIPSFRLLYYEDRTPDAAMTIKAVGHQWYWSYEYPDHGNFGFDSRPIWDSSAVTAEAAQKLIAEFSPNWLIATAKPLRLLEVDNRIVLPVGANVRVLTNAADVLHSWAMPALGVKRDAVPGRLNETWLKIEREGVYYGQCSEICGTGHAYMPIVIEAVSPERFAAWVKSKQQQAGLVPKGPFLELVSATQANSSAITQ